MTTSWSAMSWDMNSLRLGQVSGARAGFLVLWVWSSICGCSTRAGLILSFSQEGALARTCPQPRVHQDGGAKRVVAVVLTRQLLLTQCSKHRAASSFPPPSRPAWSKAGASSSHQCGSLPSRSVIPPRFVSFFTSLSFFPAYSSPVACSAAALVAALALAAAGTCGGLCGAGGAEPGVGLDAFPTPILKKVRHTPGRTGTCIVQICVRLPLGWS